MRKYTVTIAFVILSAGAAFAQNQQTSAATSASSATSAAANGQAVDLQSGTKVMAQLQNTLDVRKAKVGDQVVLKTTEAIKSNGRTVVGKGARLVGHVTQVAKTGGDRGESSIGLLFDRLESGALDVPINATITSITRAATRTTVDDAGLSSDSMARSSTSTGSSSSRQSSGGGLLGGVTSTAGGVLNTTTQTAGSVVGGTTSAVGQTVGGVTRNVGGIRISESADASAEGSSTLSLTGDNIRLEKGTSFNLRLSQSATVDTRDNQ